MNEFSFLCRTKTAFGAHALEHLPFEFFAMGAQKPMVIQDRESHLAGSAKKVAQKFKDSGMVLGIAPPIPEPSANHAQEDGREEQAVFIRSLYEQFTQKGYDALVVLGKEEACDTARALGIAVNHSPAALTSGQIPGSVTPTAFVPTATFGPRATADRIRVNGQTLCSPFLAPDMAVVDPAILIPENRDTLLDRALTFLATACEVHALSANPPARAYAATQISFAKTVVEEIIRAGLDPKENLARQRSLEKEWQYRLVQAAVINGYLSANHNGVSRSAATLLAARSKIGHGPSAAIVLPCLLEALGPAGEPDTLLSLKGAAHYTAVPLPQRWGETAQTVRSLVNDLHRISRGRLPATLGQAGWNESALGLLAPDIAQDSGRDLDLIKKVLICACHGKPCNGGAFHV